MKAFVRGVNSDLDISQHVANMFDALINSMDWGSDFLDSEQVDSIMVIAKLMGYDIPELSDRHGNLEKIGFNEIAPDFGRAYVHGTPEATKWYEDYKAWEARKKEALTKWGKQRAAELVQKMIDEAE